MLAFKRFASMMQRAAQWRPLKRVHVRSYERGLLFRDGEFIEVMQPGKRWFIDPIDRVEADVVSLRDVWLMHPKLDVIVKAGLLGAEVQVLEPKDHERVLVWLDGRFDRIVGGGRYVLWTGFREVKTEVFDAREARFEHAAFDTLVASPQAQLWLQVVTVDEHSTGVLYVDGQFGGTLPPGRYAFWRNVRRVQVHQVDRRESVIEIAGQDIMTADMVTLRLNAVATVKVVDARKAVETAEDARQALYREAQLALRAMVGTRALDALLADKDALANELAAHLKAKAPHFGAEIVSVGVRDIILPGEMRGLLNKVTEAKKAAEANLIVRREETAAMRSQANTAKLLENNPTLMRLRELEVLEKVAGHGQLQVVVSEKGLADRIVNLL